MNNQATYWYRVDIFERDLSQGRDMIEETVHLRSEVKLSRVNDAIMSENTSRGLIMLEIDPTGAGPDLVQHTQDSGVYVLCDYRQMMSRSSYKKLKYVNLSQAQIEGWRKFGKDEERCNQELKRIETEIEILNAQRRRVLADRRENSKKRFRYALEMHTPRSREKRSGTET